MRDSALHLERLFFLRHLDGDGDLVVLRLERRDPAAGGKDLPVPGHLEDNFDDVIR